VAVNPQDNHLRARIELIPNVDPCEGQNIVLYIQNMVDFLTESSFPKTQITKEKQDWEERMVLTWNLSNHLLRVKNRVVFLHLRFR
jgi:hypothetical protein